MNQETHELLDLILHGREERNLEYKGPVSWNDPNVKAFLTKVVLAMSNIRDGGAIVVGVEQINEEFRPLGLQPDQLESFTQDGFSSHVNEFADPYTEVTVSSVAHEGRTFVVIQVEEFAEVPVVCKRDGAGGLRKGAVYTRTRRMHETAEVPSQAEMREIIDVAVEKGIRAFQSRIRRTGLEVGEPGETDRDRFDEQLEGL